MKEIVRKNVVLTAVRPEYPPLNLICGKVDSGIHPVSSNVYVRRNKIDYSELRPKALIGPTASTIDFVKEMEENIDILKSKK